MNSPAPRANAKPATNAAPFWQRPIFAFLRVWERTINIGVHEGLGSWERKRVRLLNGIACFSIILFAVYILLGIWSPDWVTTALCGVIFLIQFGVLILNHFRLYNASAYYYILAGTAFYSLVPIAKKHDGSEYTLIIYSLMGMIFFRKFWQLFILFWINVAAFFAVRYAITVIPPFLYIPEMSDVYNTNIFLFFAGLFAVVYYFRVENSRQEKQLNEQNERLQASLADLHAAQAQLVQREKLASLGELTAGVAHEIQNPLNFVNNFAELSQELIDELAEEQGKGPDRDSQLETELLTDLQKNIGKISDHGWRAAAIVRGMLEHSRASKGERKPTDLNELCAESLRLSYESLKLNAALPTPRYHTEFDPALLPLNVVRQDVGRVMLNLINNAFYAVLQKQQQATDTYLPEVWVKTQQLPNKVEIRVSDNGTGIDSQIQTKIFQPFFTTKPTGSGTGLGLSLSYDIITKGYGGTLTVHSNPGYGAEFIITLPKQQQ